ncbi:MAG: preprotein translocase subunit SecG [Firmicutes bacterium ADurb.Bin182]|nr:MAG: preprotein translocase subunit SecG [Firmicutes bacterium ADurb.Bin182]
MDVLRVVFNIILILASVLLIAVVLMQSTKSSGLGSAFGGDTQSFTPRGKAASKEAKLQKLTKITAIVIGVIAVAMMIIG